MLRFLIIFVFMFHNSTLNAAASSIWQRATPSATAKSKRALKSLSMVKKLLNKKTAPPALIVAAECHNYELVHSILDQFSKEIPLATLEIALKRAQESRPESSTIALLELQLDSRRQCTTLTILGF